MIYIGKSYTLEVVKMISFGVYLDADNLGTILLPKKFTPNNTQIGDNIHVFLYLDSEDRLVATTQTPKAQVGEFAYLEVTATTNFGAFLDWGLDKDLLVPFGEQHKPMTVGTSYLVYIYENHADDRIVASSKLDKFLDKQPPYYKPKQAVDLVIANSTELGYKAIINHTHWGVLFKEDVFQRLSYGQSIKGYIKRIRHDGKIDLMLQGGQETHDKNSKIIKDYLIKHNGYAPVHDKTDPQLISSLFGISKNAFKRALGTLYKQRIIDIEKEGIRLLKK